MNEEYISFSGSTAIEIPFEVSDEEDDSEDDEQLNVITVSTSLPRPEDDDHNFDVLDLESLTWSQQTTYGRLNDEVPNLGNGSNLNYHEPSNTLFLFSGWNERQFSSDVFYISLDTWQWKKAVQEEGAIVPSPRYLTGVLIHNNKLCNFGGVGPDGGRDEDVGSEYRQYVTPDRAYDFGWNNQYYEFDIDKSKFENKDVVLYFFLVLNF